MVSPPLDAVDRDILRALQEDARHNTNAAISAQVDVSASTVGKRIAALEDSGVIEGYHTVIDYEEAGFPLHVLFVCTTPITEREPLVERILELEGVVNVRELMTGAGNVHVLVTGASNDDVTRIARRLSELGLDVGDEILVRAERSVPSIPSSAPATEG
mgnify:CR=1 FL=1